MLVVLTTKELKPVKWGFSELCIAVSLLHWICQCQGQVQTSPPGALYISFAVLGPGFQGNHYHVSLSFLTVTSPLPAPLAAPPPDADEPAGPGPGPVPPPDAAADAAPAPPVPSMVETSPCMKAQGGLFEELSNGQRSPLGQYTSPSPRLFWMYTLVQGKQNLCPGTDGH